MECLVKKDDVLAVLLAGCAFSRIATAGNTTFSWNCGIALPEIFEHRHRLWFRGLHIRNLALGIQKKLCAFLWLRDFSREKIRKTAALFLTQDDTVNVDSIYGDELRIDHIYRSLNKCHSFTCPSELRSFAVIVRGFVSRLFNHR